MNNQLQKLFEKLEDQRENITQDISKISDRQFHFSKNGKWSIAQILAHVISAEKLSLDYMKKKSLGINALDNSGIIESLKSLVLQISQRIPMKYRAPRYVIENTPPPISFEDLKKRWASLRSEMANFLDTISEQNVRKKIYKHPVAGRLDARQALTFFREHIIHHLPQIKRLSK
jgi:uncharacterized damage-inducible protein DinB